ncbi:sigma-70 family RNA polymerase sigma factor [Arsukibacterium sp.]|uniref:RNA polymerase sigma factor n=1 Tax=Arsukibacterium sp. TaxID=1977258 RepID=UPI001BD39CA7
MSAHGFGRPIAPEILKAAQRGQPDALKRFYSHFADAVLRLCSGMLGSAEDGRDLTQDIFIKAFACLADIKQPLAVGGWLKQLSVRLALDTLRQRNRQQLLSDDESDNIGDQSWNSAIDSLTRLDDVERIMAVLSEQQRVLVWLYAVEGYSHQQLAELLQLSEQNVRQQYRRALTKLATQLKQGEL